MSDQPPESDTQIIALPFEERAERLLSFVFGGMHHVWSLKKTSAPYPWWSCIHSGDLSTYDFDTLTRLVIGAHHYCIRVELSNGGPRAIKIMLHPRHGREGCSMSKRHPTLQQAIERLKP